MTPAELAALINQHVAAALAAQAQGAGNAGPPQGNATFKTFMDCKPNQFKGTEGAVSLLHWIKKVESAFEMCNCPEASKVKFATGTLEGPALTWWNTEVQMQGNEEANAMPWDEFKELLQEEYCPWDEIQKLKTELYNLKMEGSEIEAYTTRSNSLANFCPRIATPAYRRIELYIKGLVPQIQGIVTASNPVTIRDAVRITNRLTNQAVDQGVLPPRKGTSRASDNKRKWDNSGIQSGNKFSNQQNHQNQNRKFDNSRNFSSNDHKQNNQGRGVQGGSSCSETWVVLPKQAIHQNSQPLMLKPWPLTVANVFYTFKVISKEFEKDSQGKKNNHIKGLRVAATDCEPQYLIRLLQVEAEAGEVRDQKEIYENVLTTIPSWGGMMSRRPRSDTYINLLALKKLSVLLLGSMSGNTRTGSFFEMDLAGSYSGLVVLRHMYVFEMNQ
ncbi:hypothetical protein SSX86_011606 [Deinandra increscens subsp. villosa]|uniref:Retrotransposon gag domain-containing protein n=1 Tax=Deinandra increscens subsp. villosa TaxID=3103831 RepID=A0AAP0H2W4_9ASTR